MHCEESGDGHSPQGLEACSLGNFFMAEENYAAIF